MIKNANNFAYIDGQNLNLGIQSLGWKLDYRKFRVYLAEKYGVKICYLFLGYIPENQDLYSRLQQDGYILKFKPVIIGPDGNHKGNVDADMVLQIITDFYEGNFDQVILITSDGDFYSVVKFLYNADKLARVLSPYYKTCSTLLRRTAREKIAFIDNLRNKLEYKKKNTA
ncbi:MAG: NYN domain-containing protein [Candidatus Komeilibacteria bacterium]